MISTVQHCLTAIIWLLYHAYLLQGACLHLALLCCYRRSISVATIYSMAHSTGYHIILQNHRSCSCPKCVHALIRAQPKLGQIQRGSSLLKDHDVLAAHEAVKAVKAIVCTMLLRSSYQLANKASPSSPCSKIQKTSSVTGSMPSQVESF